jgi:hypothetical protein
MELYKHETISIEKAGCKLNTFMTYLGYKNNRYPTQVKNISDTLLSKASEILKPEYGYLIYHGSCIKNELILNNVYFKPGKTICFYLSGCSQYIILISTIGKFFFEWTEEIKKENDSLLQYILDALGSFIVDKVSEYAQGYLKIQVGSEGLNVTNSYSPGYCEWDITEQKKLFSLLPENFCGVTLASNCMMHPIKSISAVIGMDKKAKRLPYHCVLCKRQECFMRKNY